MRNRNLDATYPRLAVRSAASRARALYLDEAGRDVDTIAHYQAQKSGTQGEAVPIGLVPIRSPTPNLRGIEQGDVPCV